MLNLEGKLDLRNNGYLSWVDSAKGIAVYLVMVGHLLNICLTLSPIKTIYSFHIPLFFLASGFTSRSDHNINIRDLWRKTKRLLIPYIIFMLLSIPFGLMHGGEPFSFPQVLYFNAEVYFNEPLWFLIILIEVYFLDYLFKSLYKNIFVKALLCAFFFALGFVLHSYRSGFAGIFDHFGINRAIVAYLFFLFGSFLKEIIRNKSISNKIVIVVYLLSAIIMFVSSSCLDDRPSMYMFELNNYFAFVASGVFGSIFILSLCYLLFDYSFLANLSKHGILFMGLQYFWLIPIRDLLSTNNINGLLVYNVLCFIIPACMSFIMIFLYEKLKKKIPIIKYLNGEVK